MTTGDLKLFGTAQLVFAILLKETVHRATNSSIDCYPAVAFNMTDQQQPGKVRLCRPTRPVLVECTTGHETLDAFLLFSQLKSHSLPFQAVANRLFPGSDRGS